MICDGCKRTDVMFMLEDNGRMMVCVECNFSGPTISMKVVENHNIRVGDAKLNKSLHRIALDRGSPPRVSTSKGTPRDWLIVLIMYEIACALILGAILWDIFK